MRMIVLGLAAVVLAGPAAAQSQESKPTLPLGLEAQLPPDPNGEPNYGTVTLAGNFTPDPRVIALRAGGEVGARAAGSNCSGFITRVPDVRLNFTPGSLPLIVSVASTSDTTLVINAPDGRWHCNDDGGVNGGNPSIRFNTPAGGRYEIWVGTYRAGTSQPARLHISEATSQ